MKELHNTLMVLTNPDAAQSVVPPLCLLSGLAAHQHVGQAKDPGIFFGRAECP